MNDPYNEYEPQAGELWRVEFGNGNTTVALVLEDYDDTDPHTTDVVFHNLSRRGLSAIHPTSTNRTAFAEPVLFDGGFDPTQDDPGVEIRETETADDLEQHKAALLRLCENAEAIAREMEDEVAFREEHGRF